MKNWRNGVLDQFQAPFDHLILVSDPHQLLQDEEIVAELLNRSFLMVDYRDHALFRYLFELEYRPKLHKQPIIIRVEEETLDHLPYDLLRQGKEVYLSKNNLFPALSPSLVQQLETAALDQLSCLEPYRGRESENESAHYLLTNLFRLRYDQIDTATDLIALLIQRHQLKLSLPDGLEQFLYKALSRHSFLMEAFNLKSMLHSKHDFYAFLQHEWEQFVRLGYPEHHLFHDENLIAHLMRLFYERELQPVEVDQPPSNPLYSFGVTYNPENERRTSLEQILKQLEEQDLTYMDRRAWIEVVRVYGRLKVLYFQLSRPEEYAGRIRQIEEKLDERFEHWLHHHYAALVSLTDPHTPVMVHKVAEFLHLNGGEKKAILVLDGMGFVQWEQIAEVLRHEFLLDENGSYAWIPTLTSISRQAIFSGLIPKYYADSIKTTAKEEKLWMDCWKRYGLGAHVISFEKGLGQGAYERSTIKALSKERIKVAGVVIDMIDRMMHGSVQGHAGIYEEIDLWLRQRYLQSLLHDLLAAGFSVYLTSDHGNRESRGTGRYREGSLVETLGERVRIYRYEELKEMAAEQIPADEWNRVGLPDDFYPLLARGKNAFIKEGGIVVSHGGASFEEVIVPFVKILPKND